MTVQTQRVLGLSLVFGLAALALQALWRLLTGAGQVFGFDAADYPFFTLVALSWGALYVFYRWPRTQESVIAPGEWRAWIGFLVIAQLIANVLLNAWRSEGASLLDGPYRGSVVSNTVLPLVAWMVVYTAVGKRWRGQVVEDERDREIDRVAAGWGNGGCVACIVGIAVMLGMSPPEKLLWATPPAIANLLIFSLLWGALVQCAVSAIQYVRDRR